MGAGGDSADLIMVATGTGIAPFRGFINRLFIEDTPAARAYTGNAWLVLGGPVSSSLLYSDVWDGVADAHDNFQVTYAVSREMQNSQGGKMYVQDAMAANAAELFEKLDNGAHIYFCGLKGMMPGIEATLEALCIGRGLEFKAWFKALKKEG